MEIGEQVRRKAIELAAPEDFDEALRRRILEVASPEERLAGMTQAERRALLRLLQEEMGTDPDAAEDGESETT
jgi:hypothetical protein